MKDTEIVELYWQRSERAISESEQKYGAYCRTVAYNILENSEDTVECVNDTWLSAWNAMPDKRPGRLGAFLARITRNGAISKALEAFTAASQGQATKIIIPSEIQGLAGLATGIIEASKEK